MIDLTKKVFGIFWLIQTLIVLDILTGVGWANEDLPAVNFVQLEDFAKESKQMRLTKRPMVLMFVADYCSYCEVVKEEFLKPMLRSGDYDHRILIRHVSLDSFSKIRDQDGKKLTVSKFAQRYNVFVTPTVVFLDADGNKLAKSLVGVSNIEYYGGELDDAIDASVSRMPEPVNNRL